MLPLGPKPVISWCIDTLLAAGLEDIVVVLGPTGGEIAKVIHDSPVTIACNITPDSDMAGSIKTGMQMVLRNVPAILIHPVDYPLVSPATVSRLLQSQSQHPDKIIIPTYKGRKGHPVLFPRQVLAELAGLPTLRHVVRRDPQRIALLAVDDNAILFDMDTPEEYRQMQTRMMQI